MGGNLVDRMIYEKVLQECPIFGRGTHLGTELGSAFPDAFPVRRREILIAWAAIRLPFLGISRLWLLEGPRIR